MTLSNQHKIKFAFKFQTLMMVFALFSLSACYYDSVEKLYPSDPNFKCDTANTSYATHVKPIIKVYCTDQLCHVPANASGGIVLDNYDDTKSEIGNGRLLNAIKYLSGGSRNMPPSDRLSDCEIARFETWIKNGAPNN